MALVAEGLTNAEIGERLFMSPATARTHVSRILTKLGARDRMQLVVMAYESGLVRPGGGADGASYSWRRIRIDDCRQMSAAWRAGTLDGMSTYEITPTATTFLADEYERCGHHAWSPWFLVVRLVVLVLVIGAIVYFARRWRGRGGERGAMHTPRARSTRPSTANGWPC